MFRSVCSSTYQLNLTVIFLHSVILAIDLGFCSFLSFRLWSDIGLGLKCVKGFGFLTVMLDYFHEKK